MMFKTSLTLLLLFFIWIECVYSKNGDNSCVKRILYLPLDERYTTYHAFLNLAEITPYCTVSPPETLLPLLKQSPDIDSLHQWIDDNVGSVDSMILSSEMFLYGGLIASRISNDSTELIASRAEKLLSYSVKYPNLDIYVSNVVMRIPSYNGDFEEPWYWANYGADLFTYSFYLDKYHQFNNTDDYQTAMNAITNVPESAVEEFTWRRARNHNITMLLLERMSTSRPFHYFYTTLDDNAEYGFNIREAEEIKNFISDPNHKLDSSICPVYPGADEVHLVMLSRFAVSQVRENDQKPVTLTTVFRDPSNINAIPSYEGQAMISTLTQQIVAAGGKLLDESEEGDAILLVNNFSGDYQQEATQQPSSGDTSIYSIFNTYIDKAIAQSKAIGFCDNRYANGGDRYFVSYMVEKTANYRFQFATYAGWNTDGNTIGTVVSNTILLHLFPQSTSSTSKQANAKFNSLRLLEDYYYQADYRQVLSSYVDQITNTEENSSNLTPDLSFYERFSFKLLSARYDDINQLFLLPFTLNSIYYPWNRTFEIGFNVDSDRRVVVVPPARQ